MRTTLPTVLIVLFFYLIFEPTHKRKVIIQNPEEQRIKDSLVSISITTAGDLMCHSTQFQLARQSDGTYDFLPTYMLVKEYLSKADLTVGNLETVLAGNTKNFAGYPQFNSPNEYADALKKVGFDVLFTTNNHTYDYLDAGILRTLNVLKDIKIPAIGTFFSPTDRDSIRIFEVKGIKIALLAYTEFSNNPVPAHKKFAVNHIDSILIKKDIERARTKGAELVLLNLHWGIEYQHFPNDYQKNIAKYAASLGADIIFGGHPHVLQPAQFLSSEDGQGLDSCFVIYSLGNFVSAQSKRYTDAGLMLTLNLTKNLNTNKIQITTIDYVPTWVFKGLINGKSQYLIFPAFAAQAKQYPLTMKYLAPKELEFLTQTQLQKMEQAGQDSEEILRHYIKNMRNVAWKQPATQDTIKSLPLKINVLPDSIFRKRLTKKK
jgi:poly-gamma-glutamate synthesis protein (capsule biosynthesis protein)